MNELLTKLPNEFITRIKQIYPHKHPQVLNTFLKKRNTTFRINYTKTGLRDLRRKLQEEHVRARELPFPPGAFLLKSNFRKFQESYLYREGYVYVQNVSSMIVPYVLDPRDDEKILDLCAAPGAKTTQIVSLAPGAAVTAVEKAKVRYYKLTANLKIQGAPRVESRLMDGTLVRKNFPEEFDKILVDAPCSAEGRFYVHNPRSYYYWKRKKIIEMTRTQKKLLFAAFHALKPGGILVYSTCTFAPEENEGIISWFLEKFGDQLELLPIKLPIPNIREGLTSWKTAKYPSIVQRTKRIIPTDSMEGFYVAKLRRRDQEA
ncbi:MAG: RsmB/NOP family class I SAM-dependent RNA methyltransferase [Candidatus Omnitrophica bacterium]|nr:RsmB/NOP family class I SAM-dependent RNA methyltransferase [Candidatus Omnitrophota bacterium]